MRSLPFALALTVTALAATPAVAHIGLVYPPPRPGDIKTGPCGQSGSIRGSRVTELEPGSTITMVWDETIGHEGHYRVAFDDDGQDFRNPVRIDTVDNRTILADGVDDPAGKQPQFRVEVTLPDIECDSCTLQLIQVMSTAASNWPESSLYFQCADITLRRGAGPSEPPPPGNDPGGDDGADDSGSDDDSDDGGQPSPGGASGGCQAGELPGIALALALVPAWKRRRRS
jgi:hypothetical protein